MAKQPHNEHELELALTRLAGSNIAAVEYRDIMAGVVLGQMLPAGTVVKGGTSMRLRLGPGNSRVTVDFDAARNIELDDYIKSLRSLLEVGWADFTGEVAIRKQGSPTGVPFEYVMQPIDVKLAYRRHPWCTVRLEVSHNEIGDADTVEMRELPQKIKDIFAALNFPEPRPIPLMTIPFQIAQKLHGVTQRGSSRVRDLIDLQLIAESEDVDYVATAVVCRRLFKYRKMHTWPPKVVKAEDWDGIYANQRGELRVAATCDEAVAWANKLIERIDKA
jgi:hypothetical protein